VLSPLAPPLAVRRPARPLEPRSASPTIPTRVATSASSDARTRSGPSGPAGPDHAGALLAAHGEHHRLAAGYNAIAAARLLVFIGLALAVLGFISTPGPLWLGLVVAAGVAFAGLALWHGGIDERRQAALRRARYHSDGQLRVQGRWPATGEDGQRWLVSPHPYAMDLDVVGPHGLFAALDTASTEAGRVQLAAWLLDDEAALSAGHAGHVRWLAAAHDWRAGLYAAGVDPGREGADHDRFAAWLAAPPAAPGAISAIAIAIARLAVAGALVWLGWRWGAAGVFWGFIAAAALCTPLNLLAVRLLGALPDPDRLRAVALARARCLERIAVLAAAGGALPEGLAVLAERAGAGARATGELAAIANALAQRSNPLWSMGVGAVLLAEWRNRVRLHRWAARHGAAVVGWTRALAETEALACLATWCAEQGGCWPEVDGSGPLLAVDDLAHPLLPRDRRIGNDLRLDDRQVLVLTGANASGKSTFLRALALAALLARLGCTLPARRAQLRSLRLATVMRVQDDVSAGCSRFQAEVRALKRVFDRAGRPGAPLLMVFDEVLSGTNSLERRLGTQAVIAALAATPGALLVSTHDLELCRLAEQEPQRVRLAHFADGAGDDPDGDLQFDYRLREGVVHSTNALKVMRAAGLPIPRELH